MYYILEFVEQVDDNTTISLSPDRIIESVKGFVKRLKNKFPNDKKPKIKSVFYIFLAVTCLYRAGCVSGNSSAVEICQTDCLIAYNELQSNAIKADFKAAFLGYAVTHNIHCTDEFTFEDFDNLKKTLWGIIVAHRKIILKLPEGDKLITPASTIYSHEDFCDDFDEFVKIHHMDSLEDFSKAMVSYTEKVQEKILGKVLKYNQ